jgi:TnpA family transposase
MTANAQVGSLPVGALRATRATCPAGETAYAEALNCVDLSYAANRHFSIVLLNEAIADLVNAHARLDISQAWGDGTTVAADGTHMDTYLDNLLAETSVRYGKPGGIAYHHISDTYIALFTHFIPCGVWEAVYIIEGLLKNTSEVRPTTVHADTQGQSQPVFALAHLLGFDLMPRIRNWKGLTFYRPSKTTEYVHIDALFGEPGKNTIDWDLIESQFRHLMRVAISVREGAISSSTLLKRLRSGSRKNATYVAFRARERGRHGGRPKVVDDDMAAYARGLRANGVPVPEIARKLVITSGKNQGKRPSVATVYRILAEDADGTT